MSDGQNIRACEANCFTCAFKHNFGKKKTPYCALERFPILNPDIGCSRRKVKSEVKSRSESKFDYKCLTPEEVSAAKEAEIQNQWSI